MQFIRKVSEGNHAVDTHVKMILDFNISSYEQVAHADWHYLL